MMIPRRLLLLVLGLACVMEPSSHRRVRVSSSRLVEVGAQPGGDGLQFVNGSVGLVYNYQALWRTRDGGATWTALPFPRPQSGDPSGIPASLLEVHFESADVGWIVVENSKRAPTVPEENTVYRTNDGGRTWQEQLPSPLAQKGMEFSQFFLPGGSIGWIGGTQPVQPAAPRSGPLECKPWWDGRPVRPIIFHTVDAGAHWSAQLLPGSKGCRVEEIYFRNSEEGVAVAGHYVYYTDDGGAAWQPSKFLPCCTDADWHSVFSMAPSSVLFRGKTGWLSYEDGYLFETVDGGRTWRQLAHPGQIWPGQAGPGDYGLLAFSTDKRGWILGGDRAIYETSDGGSSWLKLEGGGPMNSVSCSAAGCWALSEERLYRIEAK